MKEGPKEPHQAKPYDNVKVRESYVESLRKRNYPDILSVEEVAIILGVENKKIYELMSTGKLKQVLDARIPKVDRESLFSFLLKPSIILS